MDIIEIITKIIPLLQSKKSCQLTVEMTAFDYSRNDRFLAQADSRKDQFFS
jgi:hypothetical protein